MLIDGHAYCFPPHGGANGFPSVKAHLEYLQRWMADHTQPVWRLRDGKLGDNSMLADPQDRTVKGLRRVNFRPGGFGRFLLTVDGDDYAKQYLPTYLTDLSHPPEMLVAQMDYLGLDYAVLHATPIAGFLNDFLVECVRRFPDRLLGLAEVVEYEIDRDPQRCVAEIDRAYANGLHGLQFLASTRNHYGIHDSWDGPRCRPFWDGVTRLGKPILFTIDSWPDVSVESYLRQLQVLGGWLDRYPHVPAVLTHGFPWRLFREGDRIRLPDAIFDVFRKSSLMLELLFQIRLGSIWEYPFKELHPTMKQLVDEIGAHRLIWGTDMPNVERHCTYRQCLDTFRVHCKGVISDKDIDQIIGGTVARLFKLQPRAALSDRGNGGM